MKKEDIKQKIEQFASGLDANYVVIVDPNDDDQHYRCFNGNREILVEMMLDTFRIMAKNSGMPLATLFRLMADVVEDGDKNEG